VFSCLVIGLLLGLFTRTKPKVGAKAIALNPYLIGGHFFFVLGYTLVSVLRFNVDETHGISGGATSIKTSTAYTILSCISDILLVVMYW